MSINSAKHKIIKLLSYALLLIATALLATNFYGFTQDLKPINIEIEHLRFGERDVKMSREELLMQMAKMPEETDEHYAKRITLAIADTIAHIHWLDYPSDMFNQRVPLWENYILHLMGRFSGIPEFERYHFSSPEKSIARGIGICGDASMILSQLLNRENIKNSIITFPGHVMVEALIKDRPVLLDADFGVVLEYGYSHYKDHPEHFIEEFNRVGIINDSEDELAKGLTEGVTYWNGVSHFITKKFYFEKISYIAIWLFPIFLLVLGAYGLLHSRKQKKNNHHQ